MPNKLKQQLCATNLMNCGGCPSAQMMHRIQNTNQINLRGSNTRALGAHSQSGWPFLQEALLLPFCFSQVQSLLQLLLLAVLLKVSLAQALECAQLMG